MPSDVFGRLDTNQNSLATILAQKIAQAPLCTEPFDHIYHDNIFLASYYADLVRKLPESRFYTDLPHPDARQPDGSSARLSFRLDPDNINRLPLNQCAFWSDFTRQITAPMVELALKAKFKKILEEHCQQKLELIKLRPVVLLLRDLAGYKISIHPDIPKKAITTQYYLPADDTQRKFGTVLHKRLPDGDFAESSTFPFMPNSGYAFAVTPESWHSVKVMNTRGVPRNSLMVTYYYDRSGAFQSWRKLVEKFRARTHSS